MKPPTCRSCGKEEWRHVCGGIPEIALLKPRVVSKPKVPETTAKAAKFDRAAYMRDRHAKRKTVNP